MAMIVAPLAIWLPFDLLTDLIAPALFDTMGEMRAYQKVNNVMEFFVGTFVLGIALAAVRRVATREDTSARACMAESAANYGRLLATVWSAGWRIGLGFLLLIVPGIVLTARYALALPMTAWTGSKMSGPDGLYESEALVEGHSIMILGYGMWGYAMWGAALMMPNLLLIYMGVYPDAFGLELGWSAPAWLSTLVLMPMHLVAVGVVTGTALIFRDLSVEQSGGSDDAAPVGQSQWNPILEAAPDEETGLRAVLVVTAIGLAGIAWLVHFGGLLAEAGGL